MANFEQQNPEMGPQQRLRDAFAQLLYRGHAQAVPAEAVWQAQGPAQFPPSPLQRQDAELYPETDVPMPNRGAIPPPGADRMPMPMKKDIEFPPQKSKKAKR